MYSTVHPGADVTKFASGLWQVLGESGETVPWHLGSSDQRAGLTGMRPGDWLLFQTFSRAI